METTVPTEEETEESSEECAVSFQKEDHHADGHCDYEKKIITSQTKPTDTAIPVYSSSLTNIVISIGTRDTGASLNVKVTPWIT